MRILAIDQSISSTGWAVMEEGQVMLYGTIKAPKTLNTFEKINYITNEIKQIFTSKMCEYIAIEKIIVFRLNSSKTIQSLAGLYYHLLCEFTKRNWLFIEIEPTKWKSFCNIKGKKRIEQKANTVLHVKEKYGLDVREDEADAICIGKYGSSIEIEEVILC